MISSFVDLFRGHGSGVYQIALQLFWTLTSEKFTSTTLWQSPSGNTQLQHYSMNARTMIFSKHTCTSFICCNTCASLYMLQNADRNVPYCMDSGCVIEAL